MKKKKKKKRWRLKRGVVAGLIIIVCLIGTLIAGKNIINWKKSNNENAKIKKELEENIQIIVNDDTEEEEYKVDFESLKAKNPDTIGYLKVNNTKIDYVVVKGNDNAYYLNHNFNKEWNIAGWIFADYHNKFDGSDRNTIIYGHNTQDGSMFWSLKNVLNNDWQTNPDNQKITFVTEEGTSYYQVFSTYVIEPEDYYINTIFQNDVEFVTFLNIIKERSNYDYNVEINANDSVLTLSSCTTGGNKRIVLHAKKIIENESTE